MQTARQLAKLEIYSARAIASALASARDRRHFGRILCAVFYTGAPCESLCASAAGAIPVADCNSRALFMNALAPAALKYAMSDKFYARSRRMQVQTSRQA